MYRILLALAFALGLAPAYAADNYQATQGAGTTFAAKDNGGAVLFPRFIGCDNTTTTQCWVVDSSGRLTALAVQSGTWTVQPGNTANTTAWLVTGTGGTFPATQSGTWTVQPGNTPNTTPWLVSVNDGTNTAKVTAASTAAAAADKALVTNESPNSQISTATGTTADAAYSGSGSGTLVAIMKWIGATLVSINTNIQAAIAAGTNYIGQVGIDPSKGGGTPASVAISISTATTTQLIAASGSTVIYVTSWDVVAGGTGNITLQSADTGGACANPVALTGAYPLVAQAGISKGNGSGTVLKLPSGKALCALTSAAVQMSGSAAYQQF